MYMYTKGSDKILAPTGSLAPCAMALFLEISNIVVQDVVTRVQIFLETLLLREQMPNRLVKHMHSLKRRLNGGVLR